MAEYTTLANAFELAGHIVGIFALMPCGRGDNAIVIKSRNAMNCTRLANQPF